MPLPQRMDKPALVHHLHPHIKPPEGSRAALIKDYLMGEYMDYLLDPKRFAEWLRANGSDTYSDHPEFRPLTMWMEHICTSVDDDGIWLEGAIDTEAVGVMHLGPNWITRTAADMSRLVTALEGVTVTYRMLANLLDLWPLWHKTLEAICDE